MKKTGLLLIHGFLTCTDDWDLFVPELEKLYDGVVLFKQPGHERADGKPHYRDFTADAAFSELGRTLREMEEEYETIDIMGHSMGGGMALYAAAEAKNVRRTVLLSPAIKYPRPGAFARHNSAVSKLQNMSRHCRDTELAEALAAAASNVRTTFKESVDMFLKRLLPNWSPHNLMTFERIMGRAEKYADKVECPLAVLWGELDEFIPRRAADIILAKAGSREKTFISYADMGHAMMYLGDVRALLRDVICLLSGGDICAVETEKGEQRTVRRMTEEAEGVRTVTVTDRIVKTKEGVTAEHGRCEDFEPFGAEPAVTQPADNKRAH